MEYITIPNPMTYITIPNLNQVELWPHNPNPLGVKKTKPDLRSLQTCMALV